MTKLWDLFGLFPNPSKVSLLSKYIYLRLEFSMKRIILISILLAFCRYTTIAQPFINFDKATQHLGFVRQGDTLNFQYKFTNTGTQTLIISDTKVACDCTVVDKPANPILPGKKVLYMFVSIQIQRLTGKTEQ